MPTTAVVPYKGLGLYKAGDAEGSEDDADLDGDATMPVYNSFDLTKQYLRKIAPEQEQMIEAFTPTAILPSQLGSVTF